MSCRGYARSTWSLCLYSTPCTLSIEASGVSQVGGLLDAVLHAVSWIFIFSLRVRLSLSLSI